MRRSRFVFFSRYRSHRKTHPARFAHIRMGLIAFLRKLDLQQAAELPISSLLDRDCHRDVALTIGCCPCRHSLIMATCAGTEDEPANCASECIRSCSGIGHAVEAVTCCHCPMQRSACTATPLATEKYFFCPVRIHSFCMCLRPDAGNGSDSWN